MNLHGLTLLFAVLMPACAVAPKGQPCPRLPALDPLGLVPDGGDHRHRRSVGQPGTGARAQLGQAAGQGGSDLGRARVRRAQHRGGAAEGRAGLGILPLFQTKSMNVALAKSS